MKGVDAQFCGLAYLTCSVMARSTDVRRALAPGTNSAARLKLQTREMQPSAEHYYRYNNLLNFNTKNSYY